MADDRFAAAFDEKTPAEAAAMQDAQYGTPSADYSSSLGGEKFDDMLLDRTRQVEEDQYLDWLAQDQADSMAEGGTPVPETSFIGDLWRAVKRAGASTARDVVGAPKQVLGGVRDAAQSMLDLVDLAGDAVAEGAALAGLESKERAAALKADKGVQLPEVGVPAGALGSTIRNVSQFLVGFGAAGKVLGKAGTATKGGRVARAAGQGAAADFTAFDAHEERLSNLIQEVPALANPVNGYLSASPDDGEVEGRFKNAIEGMGLGVAAEGLIKGLRVIRASREAARRNSPAATASRGVALAGESGAPIREAAELKLLGKPDAPLVEYGVPDDVAAKSLTEKGLTQLGKGDVYVNFARINSPDDIKQVIQDTSSAFKPEIDDARRGVRTNKQTALAAEDIDAWKLVTERRQGSPFNAEQSLAARQLWVGAGTKLKEVAEAAASDPSPENLFEFRRMLSIFHGIQKEVIGARTETARALQAWKIPAGGGRENMAAIESALMNYGGSEVSKSLAESIVRAGREGGLGAVARIAERGALAKTRDTVLEVFVNSILSGPKTHLVNTMSNTLTAGLRTAETAVAARMGRLLGGEDVVRYGEAMAEVSGQLGAFKDALRNASKTAKTGETGFGLGKVEAPRERQISSTTWNVRSDSFFGKAIDGIGAIANVPTRALAAEDEFFKTMGYRASLHQQAYRQAQDEISHGKLDPANAKQRMADILENPIEDMRLDATAEAAYRTFTTEPGKFVRKLNTIRGEYPSLRFVLPFINTPANIFKFVAERGPLAPLTARYKAAIAKGGREADLARTKMAMGTFTSLLSLDLALDGLTTGGGPSNPAEKANLRRQGWQPYSVKIGDRYYAYNRLDPVGMMMGLGADIGEFIANADNMDDFDAADMEEAIYASIFSVAENVTSKTYMSGLSNLMEAISDPERFGESYVKRFAGSLLVPTAVKEVATFTDPVQRQAATMVDQIKSRLPGYSEELPARRDLWGREIRYQSGIGPLYDALSPIYGSSYKPEPIDAVMQKDGWFIGTPATAFIVDGERISLRNKPEVYSRFLELRGSVKPSGMGEFGVKLIDRYGDRTMLETLNSVVTGKDELSEQYQELENPEDREDFIRKIVSAYQRAAKGKVFAEFPEIEETARNRASEKVSGEEGLVVR